MTGCSPIIIHVECAAGIREGGRTGLTAVVVGVLFLTSIFLAPLFGQVSQAGSASWAVTHLAVRVTAPESGVHLTGFHLVSGAEGSLVCVGTGRQVPNAATAPILILVGAMMIGESQHIDWADMSQAIPAFLTAMMMPFTFRYAGQRGTRLTTDPLSIALNPIAASLHHVPAQASTGALT